MMKAAAFALGKTLEIAQVAFPVLAPVCGIASALILATVEANEAWEEEASLLEKVKELAQTFDDHTEELKQQAAGLNQLLATVEIDPDTVMQRQSGFSRAFAAYQRTYARFKRDVLDAMEDHIKKRKDKITSGKKLIDKAAALAKDATGNTRSKLQDYDAALKEVKTDANATYGELLAKVNHFETTLRVAPKCAPGAAPSSAQASTAPQETVDAIGEQLAIAEDSSNAAKARLSAALTAMGIAAGAQLRVPAFRATVVVSNLLVEWSASKATPPDIEDESDEEEEGAAALRQQQPSDAGVLQDSDLKLVEEEVAALCGALKAFGTRDPPISQLLWQAAAEILVAAAHVSENHAQALAPWTRNGLLTLIAAGVKHMTAPGNAGLWVDVVDDLLKTAQTAAYTPTSAQALLTGHPTFLGDVVAVIRQHPGDAQIFSGALETLQSLLEHSDTLTDGPGSAVAVVNQLVSQEKLGLILLGVTIAINKAGDTAGNFESSATSVLRLTSDILAVGVSGDASLALVQTKTPLGVTLLDELTKLANMVAASVVYKPSDEAPPSPPPEKAEQPAGDEDEGDGDADDQGDQSEAQHAAGADVEGNLKGQGDWFEAKVVSVRVSRKGRVLYTLKYVDDGEVETDVHAHNVRVPEDSESEGEDGEDESAKGEASEAPEEEAAAESWVTTPLDLHLLNDDKDEALHYAVRLVHLLCAGVDVGSMRVVLSPPFTRATFNALAEGAIWDAVLLIPYEFAYQELSVDLTLAGVSLTSALFAGTGGASLRGVDTSVAQYIKGPDGSCKDAEGEDTEGFGLLLQACEEASTAPRAKVAMAYARMLKFLKAGKFPGTLDTKLPAAHAPAVVPVPAVAMIVPAAATMVVPTAQYAQNQPAQMQPMQMQHAQMQPMQMQHAQMQPMQMQHAQMQPMQMQHAQMQHAQMQPVQMQHALMQPVQMQHAQMQPAQPVVIMMASGTNMATANYSPTHTARVAPSDTPVHQDSGGCCTVA